LFELPSPFSFLFSRSREFQFRVKSISGSYFTPEEVKLLSGMGNDAARARFLAGWFGSDQNQRAVPLVENSKRDKLKDFIREVFQEKRFEGEGGPAAPAAGAPIKQLRGLRGLL
jgi:hypothetical protein